MKVKKKGNWIQIYYGFIREICSGHFEYKRMIGLGWAKYPDDTLPKEYRVNRFFSKSEKRGDRFWQIHVGKVRICWSTTCSCFIVS